MNAELLINVLMDYLEAKDLEIVKNLYKGDNYVRLKWKYAKDIFSGQQITGLDLSNGKIGLTSKYSTAKEIENILKSNDLHYDIFEDYFHYHFTVNQGKLKIDFLSLYKNDSDKFLNYFRLLNKEEKKDALKEIIDCEHNNPKVTDWLSEHETDLLREVSFND